MNGSTHPTPKTLDGFTRSGYARGVAQFGLSRANQEKKEMLADWFLRQEIDGEPVSGNLADAMATLIRLPSSQRGGAKRMGGPEFSRAS